MCCGERPPSLILNSPTSRWVFRFKFTSLKWEIPTFQYKFAAVEQAVENKVKCRLNTANLAEARDFKPIKDFK